MISCRRSLLISLPIIPAIVFALIAFETGCVRHHTRNKANDQQSSAIVRSTQRLNINAASANELETLPGIGKSLAARIIEHREKYGPFRRPEHLIIVQGMSDKKFRALRDLVTTQ